jgi:hypothetical protein
VDAVSRSRNPGLDVVHELRMVLFHDGHEAKAFLKKLPPVFPEKGLAPVEHVIVCTFCGDTVYKIVGAFAKVSTDPSPISEGRP